MEDLPLMHRPMTPLPPKVEEMVTRICIEKNRSPPDSTTRKKLAEAGEGVSLEVLSTIYNTPNPIKTLGGYITFLINKKIRSPNRFSPSNPPASASPMPPPPQNGECSGHHISKHHIDIESSSRENERPSKICRQLQFSNESKISEATVPQGFSYQATVFSGELEFRKEFLLYNYIGRNKLEAVVSDEDADRILEMKDNPMDAFERRIWNAYGHKNCLSEDRVQSTEWDSGKTYVYYCNVYPGGIKFKGPYLSTATTHLQRTLGGDNVLIVKFLDVGTKCIEKICKEGIGIGLRRFQFYVFKDEGKDGRKEKRTERDESSFSTSVKGYFVRLDFFTASGNNESCVLSRSNIHEARCHFMHVHKVSSLAKYMARFSLILSKTIKLPINLSRVVIETIQDIPCRDENGCVIRDEAGELLILTDGTGFISEDLAMKCPQDLFRVRHMKDKDLKKICDFVELVDALSEGGRAEASNRELPLLMQCRLFSKGTAVKGTLLVNRQLGPGKIHVRPSMVKVERDQRCNVAPTFDSLEIVAVSYGGVPRSFFMDVLTKALEETQTVFSDKFAALKVAIGHGDKDVNGTVVRMIAAGVPLNEPHLQELLVNLAKYERKNLNEGKLPISESFYLMGTADPTGKLERNQICVILENGQISGKVLVYRNPGLHFGDIHILEAVYVKELEDIVGNAKFGIFFSTKGHRSPATEMANGDFDGDMYWVSRNPQLLRYFKPNKPWTRVYSTPPAVNKKPNEFSAEELENELFQLFLEKRKPSFNMAVAANSWLSYMDRLLILGDNNTNETEELIQKMLKLIDIYYDSIDAPKSGKKVNVPEDLRAEKYPHYMGRGSSYISTSVLGDIFEKVEQFKSEGAPKIEIWKLPCFDVKIPDDCMKWWEEKYNGYRYDMQAALEIGDQESRKSAADGVVNKYKQLYEDAAAAAAAPDPRESPIAGVYIHALALYHVAYNYALRVGAYNKCGFAWRVAGSALCKFHAMKMSESEDPILMVPSVLRDLMS